MSSPKALLQRDLQVRMLKARSYDDTEYGTRHETVARRLKNLHVTRSKYVSLLREYENEAKLLEAQIGEARDRLDEIESLIAGIEARDGETVVSEHALLRYLERVEGLDLDAYRQKVCELDTKDVVKRGNVIITVNGEN